MRRGYLTAEQIAAITGRPLHDVRSFLNAGTPPSPRFIDGSGVTRYPEDNARFSLGYTRAKWQGLKTAHDIARLEASR